MIRFLNSIALLFYALGLSAHEIPLAFFTFNIDDNTIHLEIQFDVEDLNDAVVGASTKSMTDNQTALISKYILENFNLSVNGEDLSIRIENIVKNEEHYLITVFPNCVNDKIKSMNIKSTCLINEIDKHSNIIRLHQQGESERGFRLHKGRLSTAIIL